MERPLPGAAEPADLQVVRVSAQPLSVALRDPAGRELTVHATPSADRRHALTAALAAALARATLKVSRQTDGVGARPGVGAEWNVFVPQVWKTRCISCATRWVVLMCVDCGTRADGEC